MKEQVTIEILYPNNQHDSWWNTHIGETFTATKLGPVYSLTEESLAKISTENEKRVMAAIGRRFISITGEDDIIDDEILFEVVPKQIRFLRDVRVFKVIKSFHQYDRSGKHITATLLEEGEIFEEVFDKPNTLVKVSDGNGTYETFSIAHLNKSQFLLSAIEVEGTIPVKESKHFETQKKKLVTDYKKTRNAIARYNEKLTNIKFLLDIEDDDEWD